MRGGTCPKECYVPYRAPQPAANPFAALGSTGAAFGSGLGAFTFSAPTAALGSTAKAEGEGEGEDGEGPAVEEECQAEFKPVVQLDEVETKSGEEDEAALIEL